MWQSLCLVSAGAVIGASARWGLGLLLNPLCSFLQAGTLVANLLGCLLIGILIGMASHFPLLNAEWRLFLITGILGSFTTFSSFSAEVVENLAGDKWLHGLAVLFVHLLGGLLCTAIGLWLAKH